MTERTYWQCGVLVKLLLLAAFWLPPVSAEESEERIHINPVPGVLATTSISGANTRAVQGEFGGEGLFTGEKQPILGSLSKRGDDHWSVSLKNTTEDRFTLFLALRQTDSSSGVLSSASFSVELKPHSSEFRSFIRTPGASGAELSLRRYRNRTEEAEARSKRLENR